MNDKKLEKQLKLFAIEIRRKTLECIASIGVGHVGGSMSIADLMAVLYGDVMRVAPADPTWPMRDKLVMSKGHAGPCVYATLALKGYFPLETLKTLNQNGTILPSHTDRQKTPGIDMTTGSLGQGSSTAVGLALADRINDREECYTYLVLGDGEINEGQVWEAALFTSHHKLSNLITIVDHNKLQVDNRTEIVCDLGDIAGKYRAFGFNAIDVEDGHDVGQIYDALMAAKASKNTPTAIVLHTHKGAGLSHFQDRKECHHCAVTPKELAFAMAELDAAKKMIEQEVG